MKSSFSNAGLSIPVSISDMAYGWQQAGDTSAVAAAVDFFMINNFPYFAFDAGFGSDATSWNDFTTDMSYFMSISQGKPLLVTQVCNHIFFFLSSLLSLLILHRLAGQVTKISTPRTLRT